MAAEKVHVSILQRILMTNRTSTKSLAAGAKLLFFVWVIASATESLADDNVDFGRDIRPILSDHCFQCHGPDTNNREAALRLDVRESAMAKRDDRHAVVPGEPDQSELVRRITSTDPDQRMPPPEFERRLSATQIELISRWIQQGAQWQAHWSFVSPRRPDPPALDSLQWCRNSIDDFVLARLSHEGLSPSPETSKPTLLRRVYLDLTGLPPTPSDVDAFESDESPGAYEKVVDRLLSSPSFGERMASTWLDAARYADTSGYQNDGPRSMWRWRDWVIEAINQDMPFDQFTIEQIAGDMLPNSTLDQQIATAFNRNHRGNAEGGIIAEEYQVEYVVDRVDTTATVWLGLTMGCSRCHDHKYDPITQRDFYQVFAFFNNIPEYGRAIKQGNSPPYIQAPTRQQQQQISDLDARIAAAESKLQNFDARLETELVAWENSLSAGQPIDWQPSRALLAHFPLDEDSADAPPQQESSPQESSTADQLDVKFLDGEAEFVAGRLGKAAIFDSKRFIDAGQVGKFGYFDKFSIAGWIYLHGERGGTVLSRMTDEFEGDGWYLQVTEGHVQVNLVKRWLDDSIRVETERRLTPGSWHHVAATYDGSRLAKGVTIAIDGEIQTIVPQYDFLNQSFVSDEPLRIGGGNGPEGRFGGLIDDIRIYSDVLSETEITSIAARKSIREIVATTADQRSTSESKKLRQFFTEHHASTDIRSAQNALRSLTVQREKLIQALPTVMVMQEMKQPRDTFVLARGRYNRPGDRVSAGIPSGFPPLPPGASNDRLGFASWLVDRSNPLTARVTVNRWWQMLFGTGLVKTVEDFGTQGDRPSHPQLLDWLAVELMDGGWSTKKLLRTIVTSATYRQSSKSTPQLRSRDPKNRFLARGPRMRISAAMIRDQALAISGLLAGEVGGESVRPYQPAGLWKDIATDTDYVQAHGAGLYRRSLYTYWKRTVAPPNMMVLDATSREACTVRQTRTNTPLQALALMNDVTFVEAARIFAQRVLSVGGDEPAQRLRFAFRLATARNPTTDEQRILLSGLDHHLAVYDQDDEAASQLVDAGEAPPAADQDAKELAAYTAICSLILNLDETITKE